MKTKFEITKDHLTLAKAMYVSWDGGEYGAPAIDCKRPYGNSDVEGDIAELLKISDNKRHEDDEPYYKEEDLTYIRKIHEEMKIALQIFLCTLSFEIGKYEMKEDYDNTSWKKIK